MLREVVSLLPDVLVRCSPGKAEACAGLGVILWLCGGRFSRSILTLAAVAAGTFIGMRLPAWRGWQIDGMGLGVGGAVLLGASAFLFHRTFVALLLSGALILWAAMTVWIFMAGDNHWDWSGVYWDGDMVQYLRQAWHGLPRDVSRVFPAACFAALTAGIAIAVFLPKLAKVMAHSLTGVSLMTIMGAVAAISVRPQLLASEPGTNGSQGLMLIGLVFVGVIVQWQITPPLPRPGSNAARKS
jgi:hypothetical protein